MPLLANVTTTPGGDLRIVTDGRRLDFASLAGVQMAFPDDDAVLMLSGITGLEIPPRRVTAQDFPGLDGQRLTQLSTGSREVVIPFLFDSPSGDVRTSRAALAKVRALLDYRATDYALNEGTFDLVATGVDGTGTRYLRVTYVDGMEGNLGIANGGTYWSTCDARLLAVSPYWRGETWGIFDVGIGADDPFLAVATEPQYDLVISSDRVLGVGVPVRVAGDVPSPCKVRVVGPATTTHVTSPAGLDVTIGNVPTGQTFILDTGTTDNGRRKSATLQGVSSWSLISASPKWGTGGALPVGNTTVDIVATGATSATRISVYGTALYETAWP